MVRMLEFGSARAIDVDFFAERLAAAFRLRQDLGLVPISYSRKSTWPPSSAGIGRMFITASATDRNAVRYQKEYQFQRLSATPSADGTLGFNLTQLTDIYPVYSVEYSFLESFPKGWDLGMTTLSN